MSPDVRRLAEVARTRGGFKTLALPSLRDHGSDYGALTISDKNRIQVAGHAVELARSGGAIGGYSCSGRRGRGDPIPCSCTARPCTQGGGETEVRIELRILPYTYAAPRPNMFLLTLKTIRINEHELPRSILIDPSSSSCVFRRETKDESQNRSGRFEIPRIAVKRAQFFLRFFFSENRKSLSINVRDVESFLSSCAIVK